MAPAVSALAPAVDAVVRVPVRGLFADDLHERIALVDQQVQRLTGWLSAAAGELQTVTGGQVRTETGGRRSTVGWLAEATRSSSASVGSQVRTATALRALPLVVEAVLDGVLTQAQAQVLSRLVGRIPTEHLLECQAELVRVASGRDPVQLGAWVQHLIATHCEPALDADEADAHAARYLQTSRGADGSVKGRFCLAAGDGEAVLTAIEALARKQGDADERSAGQRRADAIVDMAEQVLRHGDLPDHGGHRPQLSYVLPADWAARQDGRDHCPTCSRCPQHRPASLAVLAFLLALAVTLAVTGPAFAIETQAAFEDPKLQARYEQLNDELRCLVCQNQTIADSNAGLAVDLRREVREMIAAGKTDDEIRDFMTQRYGDFVLYKPPVTARTYLLWGAPVILLLIALGSVAMIVAKRSRKPIEPDTEEEPA